MTWQDYFVKFLAVFLTCDLSSVSAFIVVSTPGDWTPSSYVNSRQSSILLPITSRSSIPETILSNRTRGVGSNFWFTEVSREADVDGSPGKLPKLPAVSSLDANGFLPPSAYRTFGDSRYEPKPSCALSLAVDLNKPSGTDSLDSDEIVSGLIQCIDSGFTTFHLGLPQPTRKPARPRSSNEDIEVLCPSWLQNWGEENVFGKLRRSIPASIMKSSCHLVVPLMTPPAGASSHYVNVISVREAITESLSRMGTDSIDTLQLQCKFHICC